MNPKAAGVDKGKRWKVTVVTGHPTQWEGPLFGHLQRESALDLRVVFGSRLGVDSSAESESGLRPIFDMPGILDGYSHEFARPKTHGIASLARLLRPMDAVIVEGYAGFPQRQAVVAALASRVPVVLRLDSTHLYPQPLGRRAAKRVVLPWLFRSMASFLALSSPTVDYLRSYGVPAEAIVLSQYRVDNRWYEEAATRHREERGAIRDKLGVGRFRWVVLAILRFERRENPIEFLKAAERLGRLRSDVGFVLVGGGTEDREVREFVRTRCNDNVVLPGFRPITDLPRFYAASDLFVHPAREECWGLSVNEAMASSVPVILSDQVGCRYDLVPDDTVGRVYSSGDVAALCRHIEHLLDNPTEHAKLADAARARVEQFSYEQAVADFEAAVRKAALCRA